MGSEATNHRDRSGIEGRGLLLALVLVSLVGLGASSYLSVLHWQVHNLPGHVSFCAVSETVNCDTVSVSQYSKFFGVPVSTWGSLFYLAVVVLGAWGVFRRRWPWPWGLIGFLNIVAVGVSAYLFLVCELVLFSRCIMCMTLYAVNMASAVLCVFGQRKSGVPVVGSASWLVSGLVVGTVVFSGLFWQETSGSVLLIVAAALLTVALGALLGSGGIGGGRLMAVRVWHDLAYLFNRPAVGVGLAALAAVVIAAVFAVTPRLYAERGRTIAGGIADIAYGHTPEGHNWIGAENPEVVIVEYSDYECPHCGQAHRSVREVVRERKDWLRLVHVHMPLDHHCNPMLRGRPFHRRACVCALAALCADRQGRFWEMNDTLFIRRCGLDAGGLAALAGEMGMDIKKFRACMKSPETEGRLRDDLRLCREMKLRPATPTFTVGAKLIMGKRKKSWWVRAVDKLRVVRSRDSGRSREGQGEDR